MATDKPVLVAPAMNPRMWLQPGDAAQRRAAQADGIHFVGPNVGEMAERGEAGPGRLAEVPELLAAIATSWLMAHRRSAAQVDAVRRTHAAAPARRPPRARHQRPDARADRSGALHRQPLLRQAGHGHRRARRARLGARVTLVTGPSQLADPAGVELVPRRDRPGDAGGGARGPARRHRHLRRRRRRLARGQAHPPRRSRRAARPRRALELVENPDILKTIAAEPAGSTAAARHRLCRRDGST